MGDAPAGREPGRGGGVFIGAGRRCEMLDPFAGSAARSVHCVNAPSFDARGRASSEKSSAFGMVSVECCEVLLSRALEYTSRGLRLELIKRGSQQRDRRTGDWKGVTTKPVMRQPRKGQGQRPVRTPTKLKGTGARGSAPRPRALSVPPQTLRPLSGRVPSGPPRESPRGSKAAGQEE